MNRLFLIGLIACAGCAPKKETATSTEPQPVTVTVTPLKKQNVRRAVSVVGTLNGYEEVILAPKVDGRVIAIRADVGDVVSPGATLLELETSDYVLSVAEARQALNAELAKLGLIVLPPGEIDVEQVPSVRRAAVGVEDAARKFKQKKDLLARAAVSRDEYDVAETEVKLAEATKTQAVTDARAILAAARLRKASLDLAEQKLRDSKLIVPTPVGTTATPTQVRYAVAERMLTEGSMVRSMPVTNAFRLVLAHALKLRVMVPERHAAEVKIGQLAEVIADAVPGRAYVGKIVRINPTVDSTNRTFQVEIEVPNADGVLKCGGFAKADIQTRTDADVPTVPPEAIVTFAGVNKIFVVESGKAKAIEVQLGTREKDWVELIGQLPSAATAVTSGQSQLVDGSAVKIRDANTAR
ncbi:efflux RND transporter periplasmic adaptor subunit [Limnoglobus roseus]|uniref:Efflux RND transporter periplasmic adaptor subunit n=1 Tax=Limnoglobus roseus TaxID=2598579 RepID=A0A5C1ABX0_9BACT|nr:efflux RND transporter periplasmic adaptor subunit [Limnoglobus roseus]QEL16075.1 efflux RND transporter periplasmic adaptor subunit [Limnoglobus roseus]